MQRWVVPLLFATLFGPAAAAQPLSSPQITIIIDDLGYALGAGRRAVNLPGPIVCAVLPQTPRGRTLAELANAGGKEVLLHLPLQSMDDEHAVEPGGITLDMSRKMFAKVLAQNIRAVPFAIGVNGHRGSLLTRHPGHMRWLMEEIGTRGLFFVDSYTTRHSVALDIARESGVPATRRDVFLDTDPEPSSIEREFRRLQALARKRGSAVGIGHPYPNTLDFLEKELPTLERQGFRLVGIRQLLSGQRRVAAELAGAIPEPAVADTQRRHEPLTTSARGPHGRSEN